MTANHEVHDPPERKPKTIGIVIPWPDGTVVAFRCLGAYDSKANKWRLDLASVVGPLPAGLREDPPVKISMALLSTRIAEALSVALKRSVKVHPDRILLEVKE